MEEAEPDEHRHTPTPSVSSTASSSSSSSLPSSNSDNNGDSSGAAASTSSQVHEEEEEEEVEEEEEEVEEEPQELEQRRISISYNNPLVNEANGDESSMIRDDTWSCVVVVLTFWFFVSMTMVLGVYGPVNVRLGPNSSLLLQPNPLFVHYMKVEELDKSKAGMVLYGFHKPPPLDVVTTWSETHDATLVNYSDKEWIYFLNKGSEFNISYSVNSLSNSSVVLVIAQGNEGITQWLEDPGYPNTTLSWNMIHGRGMIQQNILKSSRYYVALANLDSEVVEVQLNISIRASLYNTTKAYYKCSLNYGLCSFNLPFAQGNAAVLTSAGPNQSTSSEEFYVRLSYGSRWITYIAVIGGMTVFMLVAFNFFNKFQCGREVEARVLYGQTASQRAPLLSHKDDDLSSWGSSYDSVSHDEEDPEDLPAVGSLEGKPMKEGEDNNNPRRLCVICFEAPRDCFFLPCGHCVACFTCGTRIAEAAGTCPICRRNMRKVRKIFTV